MVKVLLDIFKINDIWDKTIIPLLIIRLYVIDWMIKGTGYQNGQK